MASPRSLYKVIIIFYVVPGIEPRALCVLGKNFTTELYVYSYKTSLKMAMEFWDKDIRTISIFT